MTNTTAQTNGKGKAKKAKTLRQEMADEMFGEETVTEIPKTTDETTGYVPLNNKHQINGGKGLSRREICQRAVDKLRAELEAAEARLVTAIFAEQEGTKPKSKEAKAWTKAAKVLRNLGWDESRITAELGDRPE